MSCGGKEEKGSHTITSVPQAASLRFQHGLPVDSITKDCWKQQHQESTIRCQSGSYSHRRWNSTAQRSLNFARLQQRLPIMLKSLDAQVPCMLDILMGDGGQIWPRWRNSFKPAGSLCMRLLSMQSDAGHVHGHRVSTEHASCYKEHWCSLMQKNEAEKPPFLKVPGL